MSGGLEVRGVKLYGDLAGPGALRHDRGDLHLGMSELARLGRNHLSWYCFQRAKNCEGKHVHTDVSWDLFTWASAGG